MPQRYIDNVVIDGTQDGDMVTMMNGDTMEPPFALFSPDLQTNIGGPYATKEHAEAALALIKQGVMNPYLSFQHAQLWDDNEHAYQTATGGQ